MAKLASTWSQYGKIWSNLCSSSLFGSSIIGSCYITLNFNPPWVFFFLNGDWISGWMSLLIALIPTVLDYWTATWSGLISTSFYLVDSSFFSITTKPEPSSFALTKPAGSGYFSSYYCTTGATGSSTTGLGSSFTGSGS